MSVVPISPRSRWPRPPTGGYVAEDLDRIPDLPAHTELIDGSLVFVSPQAVFHMQALWVLEKGLRGGRPKQFGVACEMTVTLGPRQRPEPDLMVLKASGFSGLTQTSFRAQDVVLAVEIVSAESQVRDRSRKPQLYADAGIPHFWLVENVEERISVAVHRLDSAAGKYVLDGVHRGELVLDDPFPVAIDLDDVAL